MSGERSWWRRRIETLRARRGHERTAVVLYQTIVAAAREPCLYDQLGVPDTMDGRFEMIGLHAALVMRRLRAGGAEGEAVAQALFDLMFADLDRNLREAGVGDLSVGRHIKGLAATFLARAQALEEPLAAGDAEGIAAIVEKNLTARSGAPGSVEGRAIAGRLLAIDAALTIQPVDVILAGTVTLARPVDGPAIAVDPRAADA